MAVIKSSTVSTPGQSPLNSATSSPKPSKAKWRCKAATRSNSPLPARRRPSNSPNWRVREPESIQAVVSKDAWSSFQKCSPRPQSRSVSQSQSPQHSRRNSEFLSVPQPATVPTGRRHSWAPDPAQQKHGLNPTALEFKASEDDSKQKNCLGGKLFLLSRKFFSQAYGLDGMARRDHKDIVADAVRLTGCSERAIYETLYGHSYGSELKSLRDQVAGYPPKLPTKQRHAQLLDILANPDKHPFCQFDGNKVDATETTDSEAAAVSEATSTEPTTYAPPAQRDSKATTISDSVKGVIAGIVMALLPIVANAAMTS